MALIEYDIARSKINILKYPGETRNQLGRGVGGAVTLMSSILKLMFISLLCTHEFPLLPKRNSSHNKNDLRSAKKAK